MAQLIHNHRLLALAGLVLLVFSLLVMPGLSRGETASREDLISGAPQTVPVPKMVTMVDIGAKACIPCKMMIPVIENSSKKYEGRAAVIFIDVWKHPDEAPKFGVRAIPTQIFYDKDGKEYKRHEGYLDQESLDKIMAELGVK